MLTSHNATDMKRACNIFMTIPLNSYREKIRVRKNQDKNCFTLFGYTVNNISDNNVINYVIDMIEEYFNKKNSIECKSVSANKIMLVLKI